MFANIKKEQDITMVVVPEAVNSANCMNVYTDLLKELADKQKYFALLDVPMGAGTKTEEISDSFGAGIGTTNLQYAAAYYPGWKLRYYLTLTLMKGCWSGAIM